MYGPAVRCKKISSIGGERSCINVSGFCLERWLLAIMDISARAISLSDRPRPGQLGHQLFADAGKTEPPSRFILSQTSAGSSQFVMQTKRLTPWPALPRSTWDYTYAYRVVTSKPEGSIDRTIVLSGDTSLYDGMEEVYAGADILLHEAC